MSPEPPAIVPQCANTTPNATKNRSDVQDYPKDTANDLTNSLKVVDLTDATPTQPSADSSASSSPKRRASNEHNSTLGALKKSRSSNVIDLDYDPEEIILIAEEDVEIERLMTKEVIDLEDFEERLVHVEDVMFRPARRLRGVIPQRNPLVTLPFVVISNAKLGAYTLKQGKFVELLDGSFLEIASLLKDTRTHAVILRGWRVVRTLTLQGKLETGQGTKNELVYLYDIDLDDPRSMKEQAIHEALLTDVIKIRCVIKTNQPRPAYRYRKEDLPSFDCQTSLNQHISENERMVLRWAYVKEFRTASDRIGHPMSTNNCAQWTLRVLQESECTPGCGKSAKDQRLEWRSVTSVGDQEDGDIREIDQDEFSAGTKVPLRYTLFDTCKFFVEPSDIY